MTESLPWRGVWVEIENTNRDYSSEITSLPWRGVWVEITRIDLSVMALMVTPLAGSVG